MSEHGTKNHNISAVGLFIDIKRGHFLQLARLRTESGELY